MTTRRLPLYECADCHHQASLTVGTVMEGSRTPLQKWFIAFYRLSQPRSINGLQLKEEIHVTYKTAWSMMHKIHHACARKMPRICCPDLSKFMMPVVGLNITRSMKDNRKNSCCCDE